MSDDQCPPAIDDGGFPGRTPLLLRRERNLFRQMAADLSPIALGEAAEDVTVTLSRLEEVLAGGDPTAVPNAAFIAGRCRVPSAAAGDRLTALLHGVIDPLDGGRLDSRALGYVEAAMSLVLRGAAEAGRSALRAVVAPEAAGSMADALATAYLAELGDTSGWPRHVALLGAADGFARLVATRNLAAFLPYDGLVVEGVPISVRPLLIERADDPDSLVADEVPVLLAEIGGPELRADLAALAKKARHKSTRRVAKDVLADLMA